ncbi:MAG: hypothetical protein ACI4D9_01685 [Lachnospiraceae bacterium]
MEGLEQRIADAVNEKLNDGTVEKLIEQYIEKAVSQSLDGIFGYSGSGKKMIQSKLDEVMIPVIEKHDFNQYIVKLDAVLTEIINNTNLKDNKRILENFSGLMKEPEKDEIKLSEIFEKYCEHVAGNVDTSNLEAYCEDGDPYYEHITANMEVEHVDKGWFTSQYDDCYINLSCNEDEDLNCRISLYKKREENTWNIICGIQESIDIQSLRGLSDFEVFMYVLKRGFVNIVIDTENEYDDDIEPEEKPEWSLD